MNRVKLIGILILLFFQSCVQNKNTKENHSFVLKNRTLILGSWAGCLQNDLYVEIHFDEEFYSYHLDGEFLDYNVGRYVFCGDTLRVSIQEKALDCNNQNLNSFQLIFVSKDKFVSKEKNDDVIYKRLSIQPLMDYKLGTRELERKNYLQEFKTRKNNFDCPR